MKGKVLVIEDDKGWQDDLKEFLEDAGFYIEVVSDLNMAIEKVQKELYHFITIDMQLNEKNNDAQKFEGWDILEIIKKLRVQETTPAMVLTGFEQEYKQLKAGKKVDSIFFMFKGTFDREEFIAIVERAVKSKDLRFKGDQRGD